MQAFPHSADYRHFLSELRAARVSAGITQQELANRLGVHQTVISKAELGVRRVDVVELRAWLAALDVSLAQFITKIDVRLSRHSRPPVLKKART